MIPDNFAPAISGALADAKARLAARMAETAPADVSVAVSPEGLTLTGRALGVRSLTDPRLRDFAGALR